MTDAAAVQLFIQHWEQVALNEKAVAQSHFNALCHLLGLKGPVEADPKGQFFRFEKPLTKSGGSAGFADVWYRDRFAWEYKTRGKYPNLTAAYQQLLLYREDLDNPPILIACDIANYEVHIAFTGYKTRIEHFTNADLASASTRELLRLVFTNPEQLRPVERQETITELAAARLAQVAQFLERRGYSPSQVAPFFMKVLFALFAEDIHLLPAELMTQSIRQAIFKPEEFVGRTRALFHAMHVGDYFGMERVPQFDGWLFADDEVLPLNADELQFLSEAAKLDWSQVEPAIFGTLFERSLDPAKRAQLGAHYTSRDDILLIVEPVLMAPLRREWATVKTGAEALRAQWEPLAGNARRRLMHVAEGMLLECMEQLAKVRVLDAACGSGNFLYVALKELKNLEKEVWTYAGGVGLEQPQLGVSPAQLFGIEKNQFAAELAQVVVWIGYLQWKRTNGFFDIEEPILKELHTIECRDAILAVDLAGNPAEPPWPEADVIIGNPPFLGAKWMQRELGKEYTTLLRSLYDGRISGTADLVMYWFEKTRAAIAAGRVKRVGLLATNTVRQGGSVGVLRRIKESGNIFLAYTDRPWTLDGAALRVSMIGFDDGSEKEHRLNGREVSQISADLTAGIDLERARRLAENLSLSFRGHERGGPFLISAQQAAVFLQNLRNTEVVFKWFSGLDLVQGDQGEWVIDFGMIDLEEAKAYTEPLEYLRSRWTEEIERAERTKSRVAIQRNKWWRHRRPATDLRAAVAGLGRFIVTPLVSKYRLFIWLEKSVRPDTRLVAFARDDDYFFGILHSRLHEIWSLRLGAQHGGERPTYNNTTCFETFPFPWPPGQEDQTDPKVQAIAEAARELVQVRDEWLAGNGPPELPLAQRTLTNLYNRRPDWLDMAHTRLDAVVFHAYGWPHDLSDDEILARLLALNLERAARQGAVAAAEAKRS